MEILVAVEHVLAFFLGVFIVGTTVMSAVKTFVLPRAANVRISRFVFVVVRLILERVAPPSRDYADRDRIFAMQAPFSLMGLPIAWLLHIVTGFTLMYLGLGLSPQEAGRGIVHQLVHERIRVGKREGLLLGDARRELHPAAG